MTNLKLMSFRENYLCILSNSTFHTCSFDLETEGVNQIVQKLQTLQSGLIFMILSWLQCKFTYCALALILECPFTYQLLLVQNENVMKIKADIIQKPFFSLSSLFIQSVVYTNILLISLPFPLSPYYNRLQSCYFCRKFYRQSIPAFNL